MGIKPCKQSTYQNSHFHAANMHFLIAKEILKCLPTKTLRPPLPSSGKTWKGPILPASNLPKYSKRYLNLNISITALALLNNSHPSDNSPLYPTP